MPITPAAHNWENLALPSSVTGARRFAGMVAARQAIGQLGHAATDFSESRIQAGRRIGTRLADFLAHLCGSFREGEYPRLLNAMRYARWRRRVPASRAFVRHAPVQANGASLFSPHALAAQSLAPLAVRRFASADTLTEKDRRTPHTPPSALAVAVASRYAPDSSFREVWRRELTYLFITRILRENGDSRRDNGVPFSVPRQEKPQTRQDAPLSWREVLRPSGSSANGAVRLRPLPERVREAFQIAPVFAPLLAPFASLWNAPQPAIKSVTDRMEERGWQQRRPPMDVQALSRPPIPQASWLGVSPSAPAPAERLSILHPPVTDALLPLTLPHAGLRPDPLPRPAFLTLPEMVYGTRAFADRPVLAQSAPKQTRRAAIGTALPNNPAIFAEHPAAEMSSGRASEGSRIGTRLLAVGAALSLAQGLFAPQPALARAPLPLGMAYLTRRVHSIRHADPLGLSAITAVIPEAHRSSGRQTPTTLPSLPMPFGPRPVIAPPPEQPDTMPSIFRTIGGQGIRSFARRHNSTPQAEPASPDVPQTRGPIPTLRTPFPAILRGLDMAGTPSKSFAAKGSVSQIQRVSLPSRWLLTLSPALPRLAGMVRMEGTFGTVRPAPSLEQPRTAHSRTAPQSLSPMVGDYRETRGVLWNASAFLPKRAFPLSAQMTYLPFGSAQTVAAPQLNRPGSGRPRPAEPVGTWKSDAPVRSLPYLVSPAAPLTARTTHRAESGTIKSLPQDSPFEFARAFGERVARIFRPQILTLLRKFLNALVEWPRTEGMAAAGAEAPMSPGRQPTRLEGTIHRPFQTLWADKETTDFEYGAQFRPERLALMVPPLTIATLEQWLAALVGQTNSPLATKDALTMIGLARAPLNLPFSSGTKDAGRDDAALRRVQGRQRPLGAVLGDGAFPTTPTRSAAAQRQDTTFPAFMTTAALPPAASGFRAASRENRAGLPLSRSQVPAMTLPTPPATRLESGTWAVQRVASGTDSAAPAGGKAGQADVNLSAQEKGEAANDVHLLANDVWALLKRRLETESERLGRR